MTVVIDISGPEFGLALRLLSLPPTPETANNQCKIYVM